MKKTVARILGLIMLLSFCFATAEAPLPEIPEFGSTLRVRPIRTAEEAIAYAKEIWAMDYLGMDFPISYYYAEPYADNKWVVYAKDGADDGDYCFGDVIIDRNGNVALIENASSGVFEIINESWNYDEDSEDAAEEEYDPYNSDRWAAWRDELDRKVMFPFLEIISPATFKEYTALYPVEEGGINEFLGHYHRTYVDSYNPDNVFDLYYSSPYHDETWCIAFAVQTSPVVRIVYFDLYGDAEEGGSG